MKEKCEYCGNVYPVRTDGMPYTRPYAKDEIITVTFEADPFESEIRHDDTPHWLCSRCSHDAYMEI